MTATSSVTTRTKRVGSKTRERFRSFPTRPQGDVHTLGALHPMRQALVYKRSRKRRSQPSCGKITPLLNGGSVRRLQPPNAISSQMPFRRAMKPPSRVPQSSPV